MKRASLLLLGALCLAGCYRTELTREGLTQASGLPYHKLLVCTIAGDPTRAALLETILARRLHKHHIVVDRCSEVFASLHDTSADQVIANLQKQNYDAVLVIQRKPTSVYSTLQSFISAYETGVPPLTRYTAPLEGTAMLLSVKQNQLIWSADGYLYGDPNVPPSGIYKAFARKIDDSLDDEGIFPDSSR